jgi:predicted membrane chloride channel (bestrophin family)
MAILRQSEQEQERVGAAEGFFSLYANLLSVEARIAWGKIVSHQIRVTAWTDLEGKTQMKEWSKTKKSFNYCIKHHLLTDNAAEKQKFYISNVFVQIPTVRVTCGTTH